MLNLKNRLFAKVVLITALMQLLLACGGNGFHLRKSIDLPSQYQQIQVENASSGLSTAFRTALEEAGGRVNDNAKTKVIFSNIRERKQAVAYTSERKARIYLLSLKLTYEVQAKGRSLKEQRINLDRNFVYDANFALGKAEEERQIRVDLYEEAARLILLRLQYAEK